MIFVFEKFKGLSTLKKTAIIIALVVAFIFVAPLTVKYASAGEIELFAMVQELFTRVEIQEVKSEEQEERIAELEAKLAAIPLGDDENNSGEPTNPGDEGNEQPPPGNEQPPGNGEQPPGNGEQPPVTDPTEPENPEPKPEPDPILALEKIDYMLGPIPNNRDGRFEYRFEGTKLYCDFYRPAPEEMKYGYLLWERQSKETEYAFTEYIDLVEAWNNWDGKSKLIFKGRLPRDVIIKSKRQGNILKIDLVNWFAHCEGGKQPASEEIKNPQRYIHTLP